MKILVTSDSTCALSRLEAAKIGLPILPLNVIVDGVEYHDGIDIDPSKLKDMMRGGGIIKTSTPTPYEIEIFFDEQFKKGYDHIVHFTISSKLSSMNSLFNTYCKDRYGDKITIIDSLAVCQFMLMHVLNAKKLADNGASLETIIESSSKRIGSEYLIFIPETLTYLKNGGRISPALAFIGNIIGLKPILTFENGEIGKNGTTRNIKRALEEQLLRLEKKKYDPSVWEILILSFDIDKKLEDYLLNKINEIFPNFNVKLTPFSINVCAHTGPGTIGFGFSKKVI